MKMVVCKCKNYFQLLGMICFSACLSALCISPNILSVTATAARTGARSPESATCDWRTYHSPVFRVGRSHWWADR